MTKRILPHSSDAEASVLGAVLLRSEAMAELGDLQREAFYEPRHGVVFEAMRELDETGRPIDVVTLEEALSKRGQLAVVGGLSFLSHLALKVPTADNIGHYAGIVQEKHAARMLILAASEVAERGYADYGDIDEFQADAMAKLGDAVTRHDRSGPQTAKELVNQLVQELDRRYAVNDGITGVPTGFSDLDYQMSGMQPSELVVLAARPGMGKTALGMGVAKNCAESGFPVLVISLEMSGLQLMERLLSAESSVATTALRTGRITRQRQSDFVQGFSRLAGLPLAIDETPNLSLAQVRARARRFAAQWDGGKERRGLIVVDYMQLMRGADKGRQYNREQEIAEISRGLKALAKELSWPVLALSQLNRSVESRNDKRPQLSDLRESGAIEQDADVVLFIYRDEVYNEDTDQRNIAEIGIAKYRGGATGVVKLRFDGQYTKFSNLTLVENHIAE